MLLATCAGTDWNSQILWQTKHCSSIDLLAKLPIGQASIEAGFGSFRYQSQAVDPRNGVRSIKPHTCNKHRAAPYCSENMQLHSRAFTLWEPSKRPGGCPSWSAPIGCHPCWCRAGDPHCPRFVRVLAARSWRKTAPSHSLTHSLSVSVSVSLSLSLSVS